MLGLSILTFVLFRLQRRPNDGFNLLLLLPLSLVFIAVSLFPSLVNMPAEILYLDQIKGGRIITTAVIGVIILWLIVVRLLRRVSRLSEEVDWLRLYQSVGSFFAAAEGEHHAPPGAILIVMPALNEAENLVHVLPRIPREIGGRAVRALVIDDGSTDGTGDVARRHDCLVLRNPIPTGGGFALRAGYAVAKQLGYEVVVTMDADGQHRPEECPALVLPILEDGYDFVIGSRQLGHGEHYSYIRAAGVKLFSIAMTVLMGKRITDCSSGYRGFRVDKLAGLPLRARQYHTAETIIVALKHKLRLTEVPVTIVARLSGESKKGHDFFYAVHFLKSIVYAWWR